MGKPILSLYSSVAWRHPFGVAKVCDWAVASGFDAIDVRGSSVHVPGAAEQHLLAFGYDMLAPDLISPAAISDVRNALADAHLGLTSISCYASLTWAPSPEQEASLAAVRAYLALAAQLGADSVRTIGHTAFSPSSEPIAFEQALAQFIANLRLLVHDAQHHGIKLIIETNENSITERPETCVAILEQVGSPWLQLAVDPVNLYLAGEDVVAAARQLAPKASMVHVKNVRQVSAAPGTYEPKANRHFIWATLRDGDLQWPDVLAPYLESGKLESIVYEFVNPFKGMDKSFWNDLDPAQSSREAAALLRELITR